MLSFPRNQSSRKHQALHKVAASHRVRTGALAVHTRGAQLDGLQSDTQLAAPQGDLEDGKTT